MEAIFSKLDFDNPILDAVIVGLLVTLIQYLETIYDDKKTISLKLSLLVSIIVFFIVYYIVSKYMKLNITTQEIFTDMGQFN
jgi:UDP-N-acetylmuramyl pentapeptide phosphotransferase/UDP-N-acetylglucosamine-1-phosphate transferase